MPVRGYNEGMTVADQLRMMREMYVGMMSAMNPALAQVLEQAKAQLEGDEG